MFTHMVIKSDNRTTDMHITTLISILFLSILYNKIISIQYNGIQMNLLLIRIIIISKKSVEKELKKTVISLSKESMYSNNMTKFNSN